MLETDSSPDDNSDFDESAEESAEESADESADESEDEEAEENADTTDEDDTDTQSVADAAVVSEGVAGLNTAVEMQMDVYVGCEAEENIDSSSSSSESTSSSKSSLSSNEEAVPAAVPDTIVTFLIGGDEDNGATRHLRFASKHSVSDVDEASLGTESENFGSGCGSLRVILEHKMISCGGQPYTLGKLSAGVLPVTNFWSMQEVNGDFRCDVFVPSSSFFEQLATVCYDSRHDEYMFACQLSVLLVDIMAALECKARIHLADAWENAGMTSLPEHAFYSTIYKGVAACVLSVAETVQVERLAQLRLDVCAGYLPGNNVVAQEIESCVRELAVLLNTPAPCVLPIVAEAMQVEAPLPAEPSGQVDMQQAVHFRAFVCEKLAQMRREIQDEMTTVVLAPIANLTRLLDNSGKRCRQAEAKVANMTKLMRQAMVVSEMAVDSDHE